jgi:hypothetical protein
MRIALWTLTLIIGACLVGSQVTAQDKAKDVTLKGTVLCAKCALKEGTACQTAIQVKENGKDVVYYFKDKGSSESYHEEVCGGEKSEGTVMGSVTEKDGKKWIAPKKVEYAKKK